MLLYRKPFGLETVFAELNALAGIVLIDEQGNLDVFLSQQHSFAILTRVKCPCDFYSVHSAKMTNCDNK